MVVYKCITEPTEDEEAKKREGVGEGVGSPAGLRPACWPPVAAA